LTKGKEAHWSLCKSTIQCSVNDQSTSPNMQSTHTYYCLVVNFIF